MITRWWVTQQVIPEKKDKVFRESGLGLNREQKQDTVTDPRRQQIDNWLKMKRQLSTPVVRFGVNKNRLSIVK